MFDSPANGRRHRFGAIGLLALSACATVDASEERAESSESNLVGDLECSPHPWASEGSCGGAFRSSAEGPRVVPHVVYETNKIASVLAASDGSLFFRREIKRYSSNPGWVDNHVVYGETRLDATNTAHDYEGRTVTCDLTPEGRYYTCDAVEHLAAEALDPAGNTAVAKVAYDGALSLEIRAAADRSSLGTIPVAPAIGPNKGYWPKIQALKGGAFAVGLGGKLHVVTPSTGAVVTCEGCDLRGVYGGDILVARPRPDVNIYGVVAWWTPATNTFRTLSTPPTTYSADGWVPLGALADGGAVLFLDPQTLDTVPDQLAIVGPTGAITAKHDVSGWPPPRVTPLSSGAFLFNGHTVVNGSSTVWSSAHGAPPQPLLSPPVASVVDGNDVTYAIRVEDVPGTMRADYRLEATDKSGAVLWTYRGKGVPESTTACDLGIAGGRRLFVTCQRHVTVFGE